jgi:hypothetical protein
MNTTISHILLCIIVGSVIFGFYYHYKPSQYLETFREQRKKRQKRHEAHILSGKMALQLLPGRHWLSPSKPLRFEANHLPKHREGGAYSIHFWTKFAPAPAAAAAATTGAVSLLRHAKEEISLLAQAPHTLFVSNITSAFAFPTRRWTHVALIRNQSRLRVFINGKLVSEESSRGGGGGGASDALILGGGGGGFRGWVSHVEYANYVLSRSELESVLTGGPLQGAIKHLRTAFAQVGCTANPVPDVGNPYSDQWNNMWLPLAAAAAEKRGRGRGRGQPEPDALKQSLAQFKVQADRAIVAKEPQAANVVKYAEKCYGRVDALNRVKLSKAMHTVSHDYKVIQHQLNRITRQLAEIRRLKKLLAVCQSHAAKIAQVQATLQLNQTKKTLTPQLQIKLQNQLAATQQLQRLDTQKLAQATTSMPAVRVRVPVAVPGKNLNQIQHSIDRNIADIGTQINTINRTINTKSNTLSSTEMANLSNRIAVLRQNNLRG